MGWGRTRMVPVYTYMYPYGTRMYLYVPVSDVDKLKNQFGAQIKKSVFGPARMALTKPLAMK